MYTQYGSGVMMGGQRVIDGGIRLGGFGIFALIGFLIVASVIVGLVIWAIARKSSRTPAASSSPTAPVGDSALTIARDRLARGEIEPEQYIAIVTALNGQSTVSAPQG